MSARSTRRPWALALSTIGCLAASSGATAVSLPPTLERTWPALPEPRHALPAAPVAGGWPEEQGPLGSLFPSVDAHPRESAPATRPEPLLFPVAGGRQSGLEKHFLSPRGRRLHHALDIVAPRNTPIRAVADGTIVRLRRSRRGGIGVEQLDATGQYCYYYAHLQRYAPGLKAGQSLTRDDLLGFVGSTGHARGAHLHFQVMKLGESGDCFLDSTPIDPFPLLELQRAAPVAPAPEQPLEAE